MFYKVFAVEMHFLYVSWFLNILCMFMSDLSEENIQWHIRKEKMLTILCENLNLFLSWETKKKISLQSFEWSSVMYGTAHCQVKIITLNTVWNEYIWAVWLHFLCMNCCSLFEQYPFCALRHHQLNNFWIFKFIQTMYFILTLL